MKLSFNTGDIICAVKCKEPKMSSHRGRVWDSGYIFINDKRITAFLDISWGGNCFFKWENQWYRLNMYPEHINETIDPFAYNTEKRCQLKIIKK